MRDQLEQYAKQYMKGEKNEYDAFKMIDLVLLDDELIKKLFSFIPKSDKRILLLQMLSQISPDKLILFDNPNIEFLDSNSKIENIIKKRNEYLPQEESKFNLSLVKIENIMVNDLESLKRCKDILECPDHGQVLGFDSESSTLPKFRLEIIQISHPLANFIFDLQSDIHLTLFTQIVELFDTHLIVGFNLTGKGDLNVINKQLTWQEMTNISNSSKNIFDIKQFFQTHVCMDKELSFKKVAHHFGYKLCKQEQVSNWAVRPLRNSQLHYAHTESFMCMVVQFKFALKFKIFNMDENFMKSFRDLQGEDF